MSAITPDPVKDRRWTPEDVSAYLGVPVQTLYQWRYLGIGPKACRVGRHLRYDPDDVVVSIHGVPVNWCQARAARAGSGGSQGFPAMALLMASSAVMPWAAAVSR